MAAPSTETKAHDAIREFVDGYEFRGDAGDHTPTEAQRAMLEDFAHGLLAAAAVGEMLATLKAFVAMVEDSLAGYEDPDVGVFVPGVTDVQITPDGSLKLSDARAVIAKAEGH